jgi:S1-C subfamily serine protease
LLVTNKHVFEGTEVAWLRFNPEIDEPAREFEVGLLDVEKKPLWLTHPDPEVDLAVIPINPLFLKENKIRFQYFKNDMHIANRKQALEIGISEGDGVFVLGFPMGLINVTSLLSGRELLLEYEIL